MTMMTHKTDEFGPEDEAAFRTALDEALQERSTQAVPNGLEQRLLAKMAQEAEIAAVMPVRQPFAFAEIGKARRSAASLWTAVGVHAVAILLIAFVVAKHVAILASPQKQMVVLTDLNSPPPPPPAMKAETMGGGGGQHDLTPVSKGRLPKFSQEPQLLKPTQAAKIEPKLAVEPTVNVQPNLKMANNNMVNLGLPNSSLPGASLGNGNGSGIGSGNGNGVGPGIGGNTGGGVYHIGGSVRAPALIFSPDPEFSEEARKAKFSGNVEVYLWVDENGNPSHVKVVRGVGMGLDEKAMEAVRQYKFRPATQNGRPVKVDLYVDVNFTIF